MTTHNRCSDNPRVNFHDLFDLEVIQNIQDAFAVATGVASIITDTNGVPITQPSNFCDLCQNVIRKTDKGLANCYISDAILGQVNTRGPTVQPCLSGGLLDGGTSIMAGDQHVANWLIGQVLDESSDIEAMKAYAREIGADEELYRQALGKVTRMPREKFDQVCQMLFLIANQLSEQAHLNVQLTKNITERVQAEAQIEKMNRDLQARTKELEEVNQDLETFSYSVSHDLRTPLTIIDGYTQIIKEFCSANLNVDCQGYLKHVFDSVQRMDELIDTILKFSVTHSSELNSEMVDLSQIAHAVTKELTLTEPSRRVTFRIDNEITTNGDAKLLQVVLENLIGNAWKYTKKKENAVIEFGVADIDGKPAWFVKDNGAGFDMAHAENLFTPFKRLSSTEDFLGHGIGLSLVDRIISRHGGKVWAESKPEEGATFFFTF